MTISLSHVGQTAAPEVNAQVQHQGQNGQSQIQDEGLKNTSEGAGEPPATRLPQHPQRQGDTSIRRSEQELRELQQRETDNEDAELRHESAV
jgi:hypothetical protein